MKEFDHIITELPYKESDEYVENLISRCKSEALEQAQPKRSNIRPFYYAIAAAAASLVAGVLLWTMSPSFNPGPMDRFLASLSDEEVSAIIYWAPDDIPEYY